MKRKIIAGVFPGVFTFFLPLLLYPCNNTMRINILPNHNKTLEEQQPLILLALTIFWEARGEPWEGKIAVGNVIRNRVNKWHKSYKEIILQPYQFSCYNTRQPFLSEPLKYDSYKVWMECIAAAIVTYFNTVQDNTDGCKYYCRKDINPSWSRNMVIKVVIGNHKFLRENGTKRA